MKDNNITRKEALKKMGKYGALTALGTLVILNPKKAQAQSPLDPGGNPFGGRGREDRSDRGNRSDRGRRNR